MKTHTPRTMKLFGQFTKAEQQDDGTLIVSGYASSEAVDSAGEVVTAEAMKAAIPDYMAFANIREMHDATKAAGTAIAVDVQEDGKTYIEAVIVDPVTIKKCLADVLKGFSIGGKVTSRDELQKNVITGIKLTEISVVDRPANPEARFTVFKAESSVKKAEELGHDLKKYAGEEVFDARVALDCLSDIMWLLDMEQDEVEDYPEQIASLKSAVQNLKAFIVSEIQEDHSQAAQKVDDQTGDLAKAEVETLAKAETEKNEALAKAEQLQKSFDDLTKSHDELQKSHDDLAKAKVEVEEQLEKIKQEPADPKAFVGCGAAVSKADDLGGGVISTAHTVKNADGSVNDVASMIKKINMTGGLA